MVSLPLGGPGQPTLGKRAYPAILHPFVNFAVSENPTSPLRRYLSLGIKILISGLALWFVFSKVDFEKSWEVIRGLHLPWFIAAVLCFNLAKIITVFRLKVWLRQLGIVPPDLWNIRIFYIGAFYNVFLPGSVSGDGYKVYLIRKRYKAPVKDLISTALLDRLSGLAALFVITCLMALLAHYPADWTWVPPVLVGLALLCYPLWWLLCRLVFTKFLPAWLEANLYSLVSQPVMVLFGYLMLLALGVEGQYWDYLVLLMLASVMSVVPLTVGGLGAREAVFVLGHEYLPVDPAVGVALAILVFVVMGISGMPGLVLTFGKD